MNISVRLYASLAEAAGTRQVDLANVPEPATAGELGAAVFRLFPPLAALCQSVIYAVNAEYVQADYPVRASDEVALIPPVSGGADPFFRISDQPLDIQTLHDLVRQPSAGAVALFVGVVRDTNLGRAVDHLEYDAYPAMAAKVMRRIADEARDRWEITAVAIHHRTGRLEIGEASVAIAVSSPHRTAAIEGLPVRHRPAQADRADLEEGSLGGRRAVDRGQPRPRRRGPSGARGHATTVGRLTRAGD